MAATFANICVDISHEKLDRPFQYKIPPHLAEEVVPGRWVMIPFGRGNREIKGLVLEVTDRIDFPVEKCKDILGVLDKNVDVEDRLVELALWMKKQYGSTLMAALKTVLPVKEQVRQMEEKDIVCTLPREQRQALLAEANLKHHVAKERLFSALLEQERMSYRFATARLGVSPTTIQGLVAKGLLSIEKKSTYRNPIKVAEAAQKRAACLNEAQQQIVDDFAADYEAGRYQTYLLHGVTGSGKTEVYMEMIDAVLQKGRQVIVLIPEIALTYQTVLRFYKRFGDIISVLNSRMSKGERYDQLQRAKAGEIQIMIGPRSALFTPFTDLGLIVIDEEHEMSYKSDGTPKYHARECARHLAAEYGASLVLGSATPSVDSYYRATTGEDKLYTLPQRYLDQVMPQVTTVDLRDELRAGNRSMFSQALAEKIVDRLEKKQQVMLFLNRRGYAGFISCRSCGQVLKCPHCDVSLTEHFGGKLVCHYCGYETPSVKACPACHSPYIGGFRVGTQQVEERLTQRFPKARILRMDKDTTSGKEDYEKVLSAFSAGEADILVGTQMIVKGHDFPNVTLVGVLLADLSLSIGDYRAGERTFQLVTQAVGRAGRAALPGEAVIQTYQPDHYCMEAAAAQDYAAFYQAEIAYRSLCQYPPVGSMLAILFVGSDEKEQARIVDDINQMLRSEIKADGSKKYIVIGPADASIRKIQDKYRRVLYVRDLDYGALVEAKDAVEAWWEGHAQDVKNLQVFFDFNPMTGY